MGSMLKEGIKERVKKWLHKIDVEIEIEPAITLFGIITFSAGKMEMDCVID
jgi:hypothetical protein